MKLLCLAAAVAIWASPIQIFRSSVDGVRVDVLVTEGRNPVTGLTAANFELRDNGVLQTIDSVSVEDVPLSVMLVLDASRSVEGAPLGHLKEAASAVVRLMTPADRAALMTFTGAVRLRTPWTSDRSALEAGIADTDANGATALHDAAYAALTLRDPQQGRPLVLVFSDGDDTIGWLPGQNVVDIARRTDAVVYAVALRSPPTPLTSTRTGPGAQSGIWHRSPGYRLDFHSGIQDKVPNVPNPMLLESLLDALAAETGGKVVNADSSDRLRETFVQVIKEFRSRYLLTYTPRGVESGGWHPIDVTLKGRNGRITARRGYLR